METARVGGRQRGLLRLGTGFLMVLTVAVLGIGIADFAAAQEVDGSAEDLTLAFESIDIELAVEVQGVDPGTPFPVTVNCADGLRIDGEGSTLTRGIRAASPGDITVDWPREVATFRCSVAAVLSNAPLGDVRCDFRGRGDTFGVSDGIVEFAREAGKDPRGSQLSIIVACQEDDELPDGVDVPIDLQIVPVGDRFDDTLPIRLRCPGAVVDGFGEVRTFFAPAGETLTRTVRWPADLPQLRCVASQRLKKSGHDEHFVYVSKGDSRPVSNGILLLRSPNDILPAAEQMWVLTSPRGASVVEDDIPLRVEVSTLEIEGITSASARFPVSVTCRDGLRVDGGVSERTFMVAAGETLDVSVVWPDWKQRFDCRVQHQLGAFGLERFWELDAYENDFAVGEADDRRIVSEDPASLLALAASPDAAVKLRFRPFPVNGRPIALNVEKLVVADDDGTRFPVTVRCDPGIGIDGGTTSKSFALAHGERASFEVIWPQYVETLRCVASEDLAGTGLEQFWELDSVRDDFHNPFNGRIQTKTFGDPELDGRTFTVINRPIPRSFRDVPMSVTKEVVAGADDTVFPVMIECNPGLAIDGGHSVAMFDLRAGESADFVVRWPTYVEQFRCQVREDLANAGLADQWELDDLGDSFENPTNGRAMTRSRAADLDGTVFTVTNRPVSADVRLVPMSVTKEVVSETDESLSSADDADRIDTVFPVQITCAPGLGVDGELRRKTFDLRAGESAEFVVHWPAYVEEFKCEVHEDLGEAGLAQDWKLLRVSDTYGNLTNGRVLAARRDAAIDDAEFIVTNAPTTNGVHMLGECVGWDVGQLINIDGHRVSGPTMAAVSPGGYEVSTTSHDLLHEAGYQVDQTDERWLVEFLDADDTVVAATGLTPDLAEDRTEQEFELEDIEVPTGVVAVRFVLDDQAESLASVVPHCVTLTVKESG